MESVILPFLRFCSDLFFEVAESDDEEEDLLQLHSVRTLDRIRNRGRNPPERVQLFVEQTILRSSNNEFQCHFRVTREVFHLLLGRITRHLENRYDVGKPTIDPKKQLFAVLWVLETPDSYR